MSLYLGKRDPSGEGEAERLLYETRHLTTHGLVFGMTGSGKTGLCIGLLEEACRAGVPVIAIDPKGDLTNLALSWPELPPERFADWVDPSTLDEGESAALRGAQTAERWRKGLAADGLGPEDIRAYRDGTRVTIYTPGSESGVPVSMLDRFAPPPGYDAMPAEDRSEIIAGIVSALLALVDVDADPLQSREHILLSNLIAQAWEAGRTLDLPGLIAGIASPPFDRLGVFELETFFPSRKRTDFAMRLNSLVASPSFAPWLRGEPIDMDRLLSRDGGVRASIFSIAHLEDSERMSFVALLLDRLIAWMRAQPGSGDLRALLYFDEVFGYLPPHPLNPPSKRPLLTLLKQARAFGLGTVLATQNPVDVDYKALTNAGTWMIGKLQAEQDRERVLDGLVSAAGEHGASLSRAEASRAISGLQSRQFLLHSAHEEGPTTFRTRWVMSYLRGPMTRQEIARLKAVDFYNVGAASRPQVAEPPRRPVPQPAQPGPPQRDQRPTPEAKVIRIDPGRRSDSPERTRRPPSAAGVPARYLRASALSVEAFRDAIGLRTLPIRAAGQGPRYRPALMARATLRFQVGDGRIDAGETTRVVFPLPDDADELSFGGSDVNLDPAWLRPDPAPGASFEELPDWLGRPLAMDRLKSRFRTALRDGRAVEVPTCPPLSLYGMPGESLDGFRDRLADQLRHAIERTRGKLQASADGAEALQRRRLDEMREQLEMDKRELAQLRAEGVTGPRLERALDSVRLRMTRFRELQATQERLEADLSRQTADAEFSALDKLSACRLERLTISEDGVQVTWFGLLWIPQ